jgi:hypothetical protein
MALSKTELARPFPGRSEMARRCVRSIGRETHSEITRFAGRREAAEQEGPLLCLIWRVPLTIGAAGA